MRHSIVKSSPIPSPTAPLSPGRQISADSGYSSAPDRAPSDPVGGSTVEGHYSSRFEHPKTLEINSRVGATEGGGKGMAYATPETTPLRLPDELVPGMENPKTSYSDNNQNSKLVVTTPSPMRPNNGKLQMCRQLSLPATLKERREAVRQNSAPSAISLDNNNNNN